MKKVCLAVIVADAAVQCRADGLDEETVKRYEDAYRRDDTLPPVVLFFDPDGRRYWLADGFHRLEAAKRMKLVNIDAEVRQGTKRHAQLYAAGANENHGLQRTNADKRKAVLMILADPEWGKRYSDRDVANVCKVDHKTVAKYRKEQADLIAGYRESLSNPDGKANPMDSGAAGSEEGYRLTGVGNSPLQSTDSEVAYEVKCGPAEFRAVKRGDNEVGPDFVRIDGVTFRTPMVEFRPVTDGKAVPGLKESIHEVGILETVTLDETDAVIDGRQRLWACCELKVPVEEIPFWRVSGLDAVGKALANASASGGSCKPYTQEERAGSEKRLAALA